MTFRVGWKDTYVQYQKARPTAGDIQDGPTEQGIRALAPRALRFGKRLYQKGAGVRLKLRCSGTSEPGLQTMRIEHRAPSSPRGTTLTVMSCFGEKWQPLPR